ncbi:MAG: HAMP domain-containing histidine kinase [Planctomycetes bacterium]|nr:HAMP domain-containing histidine kinase [Planctomycetota bacterium]MBL7143270.1 HAMP domain-containing histidine kinase [Phycisphaerae bacterium]
MCSKKKYSLLGTVTFRLTLLFVVLFTLLLVAVFVPIDFSLRSIMISRLDAKIAAKLADFSYYDSLFEHKPQEAPGIITDSITWAANSEGNDKVLWLLFSAQRDVIVSSDIEPWQNALTQISESLTELPSRADLPKPLPAKLPAYPSLTLIKTTGVEQIAALKTRTLHDPKQKVRIAYLIYPNGMTMIGVYSLRDINRLMRQYRQVLAIAFSVVLVLGGGLGFFITHSAMSGVRQVTQTAMSIDKGELGRRVTAGLHGHEIADMAYAFNRMLDRIEALVKELAETTNNIAHDLRSPITFIRGLNETTLASNPSNKELQKMGAETINECDRLIEMINTMLEIAQIDSGLTPLGRGRVDMVELVKQAVDLFYPVAEDKKQTLEFIHTHPHLLVRGSLNSLQRMVSNILDNAIKFTPHNGNIKLSLNSQNNSVILQIRDNGIGIEHEKLLRIFERFYRCDESRSAAGNGLGLSLALAAARLHKGNIDVESTPQKGSTFTVTLPLI